MDDVVVKTYVPQWGVLENDAIVASAPSPARDVGRDLCRGLVLPADQPMYDKVDDVGTCTEMLALLSMVVPWAAVVTDWMEGIQTKLKEVNDLETWAVRAEEGLRNSASELERVTGQATILTVERDSLRTQIEEAKARIAWRNEQLKASRKAIQKGKKILESTEDRVFQMGYDEAMRKAHSAGLDHSLLLESYMTDPIGRVDVEEPVVASSGEDSEFSE